MDRYFLVLILFVGLNNLIADDHMPESYGMEGYQCNFESEKNMDDVTDFISKDLNPYADKSWKAAYSGFVLTPFLRSASETNFDFGWVGFTNSHKDICLLYTSDAADE